MTKLEGKIVGFRREGRQGPEITIRISNPDKDLIVPLSKKVEITW